MVAKAKNKKKYTKLLGIEISENSLVAVEIQFIKNNVYITNAFSLNISIFQDLNKTVTLIKQNLQALNIKTKDCSIGLSMQYFKLFPVPIPKAIPLDEIDSIILQEGNIDLNNDSVTWLPLNNTQRQDPDGVTRSDILGISIQKSFVEIIKTLSKKAGLNLVSITPSFLGLGSFLNPQLSNKLNATLWISQIRAEFVVWSGQEPIYEHLFLSHQLSDHIFQSVNQIQAQLSGAEVIGIFTCGPFARETNLTQLPYNFQSFSMPKGFVDSGKVLQRLNMSEIIVPLGIALGVSNNISYQVPNLLIALKPNSKGFQSIFKDMPVQMPKSKGVKLPFTFPGKLDPQLSKFIFASTVIFVCSLLFNFFIQSFLLPGVQANLSVSENKVSLAQIHLTKVSNFEKTNKVLNVKIDFFSELIDKRKPWSRILREIGDMTPKGLWIDRLELRNNNINIFGRALDVDAIANFSINLNYTAKLLGKAEIIALKKFQEEGIDIIEFQLSTQVKNLSIVNNVNDKAKRSNVLPKT